MIIIKIKINSISRAQLKLIVDSLRQGKVIVCPTDTIYGLGCLATDKKAINRIHKIKNRSRKKPLLILVNSFSMLKKYCYASGKQIDYLKKIWPGPFTVILKNKHILPGNLTGGGNGLAVRLPNSKILRKIIRRAGAPLVSTSLNISGHKNLTDVSNISQYFNKYSPDLIIDAGKISGKPSKLINLTDINNILIVRK